MKEWKKISFSAKIDEDDAKSLNKYFYNAMKESMEIDECADLRINTPNREHELITNFIDNLCVAQNSRTVIKHLLFLGFNPDELICEYSFSQNDVIEAEQEMDEYEDTLIFA